MFCVCSIASGSSGNCFFVSDDETKFIVDAGLSGKQIELRLSEIGVSLSDIQAVVITHEHGDHVRGAGILSRKYGMPVYLREKTYFSSEKIFDKSNIVLSDKYLSVGSFEIELFSVPHDAADPVGLIITKSNMKLGIVTDVGSINGLLVNKLSKLDGLIIESNYEPELLASSSRPLSSRQRVKGRLGHLSNQETVSLLDRIDKSRLSFVMLCHISNEHNTYKKAYDTMKNYLINAGNENISVYVAKQETTGSKIFVGVEKLNEITA